MTLPRCTVIIPSLDQAGYLERAICSVLDQDYPDLELIVTDGGSSDGSAHIMRFYQDQLTKWRSGLDAGPAAAVNAALDYATGRIVCILHADDLLLPGTLRTVGQTMGQPQGPAWMVGHTLRIGQHDQTLGQHTARPPRSLWDYLGEEAGTLPRAGCFYDRTAFEQLGGLDEGHRYAWGYDLACRLLAAGHRPRVLNQSLAATREHPRSRSANQVLTVGREYVAAAERCGDSLSPMRRRSLRRACAQRRRVYTLAQAESTQSSARRALWDQLLRHPWWLADHEYCQALLHEVRRPQRLAA